MSALLPVPESEQRVLDNLLRDLNETYPDKVIVRLQQDHKKWYEKVTRLYKNIGYASRDEFFAAYGFTVEQGKSGRPTNDLSAIVEELLRRYEGDKCVTSIDQLKEENPDLAPKLKSLQNKAKELFGMTFNNYLKEKGVFQSDQSTEQEKTYDYRKRVDDIVNELIKRYEDKTAETSINAIKANNSDIEGIDNIGPWIDKAYGQSALKYLIGIGLIKTKNKQEKLDEIIAELSNRYKDGRDLPQSISDLIYFNRDIENIASISQYITELTGENSAAYLSERKLLIAKKTVEEKLEEAIETLTENYKNRTKKVYSIQELAGDRKDITNNIYDWVKKVHNKTATEYLQELGILDSWERDMEEERRKRIEAEQKKREEEERAKALVDRIAAEELQETVEPWSYEAPVYEVEEIDYKGEIVSSIGAYINTKEWKFVKFQGDGLYIYDYLGADNHIILPAYFNGEKVKGICSFGLGSCSAETVEIPGCYKTISENTGFSNESIKKVIIGEGIESISSSAFSNNKNISEVYASRSIRSIDGIDAYHSTFGKTSWYSSQGDYVVLGSVLLKYMGKSGIMNIPEGIICIGPNVDERTRVSRVIIPSTVKKICSYAFGQDYSRQTGNYIRTGSELKRVEFTEGVEIIGEAAFKNCCCLEIDRLPQSIKEIQKDAFYGCLKLNNSIIPKAYIDINGDTVYEQVGLSFDNLGCIVKDGILQDYVGTGYTAEVTDGVTTITRIALSKLLRSKEVILPDSVKEIDAENLHLRNSNMNIPAGYLQRKDKLSSKGLLPLLYGPWRNTATAYDYAYLYLYQGGKALTDICLPHIINDIDNYVKVFIEVLEKENEKAKYVRIADLIMENKDRLSQETIAAFYQSALTNKAKKASDIVKNIVVSDPSDIKGDTPIEQFCNQKFEEYLLDKSLKKAGLSTFLKNNNKVMYADTGKAVPDKVLKCVIAPYLDVMTERPKHIEGYKKDYLGTKILADSDHVAATFEKTSFNEFIDDMYKYSGLLDNVQRMLPLCRYGNSKLIKDVLSLMNNWKNWNWYGRSGRSAIIVARGALMLSDTREAMLYIEKCKLLDYYARIRGTDADTVRDTQLADFGLDANGKKEFDLGNKTIIASVGKELDLTLYDTAEKKFVKSVPKRGADPDKYDAAAAAVKEMKSNLKKVVKSRNDKLFDDFLSGKGIAPEKWQMTYTNNPVLHRVAELIVWSQKGKTFIMTESGTVDASGNKYDLDAKGKVVVAHPLEMSDVEIQQWQRYFLSESLKQPFEQIWESKIDLSTVKPDRYKGQKIPYYRFVGQEKIGITVYDYDFHNEIDISIDSCDTTINRLDWARHQISMNDSFEIESIHPRNTRKANHIIYYFDKITVYGAVAGDNVELVSNLLPTFNIAQITQFISIAIENNANNCTALLLDYKNKNFADYSNMEQFTLD